MVHIKKFPKFLVNVENRMTIIDKIIEQNEEIKCLEKLLKEAKQRQRALLCEHSKNNPTWGIWLYDYYFDITTLIGDYFNYYFNVHNNKW